MSQHISTNTHQHTMVHLMVEGKYVKAQISKQSKQVELILVDQQETPGVKRYTCTCIEDKKSVAFVFAHNNQEYYWPKIEEGTLMLTSSDHEVSWLEMEDIRNGESHYLRTPAGLIGVESDSEKKLIKVKTKLSVGGTAAKFTQVPYSFPPPS